ncbi:glycoside hydrolase family 15 protein [Microbacterium dextranolyticum]|uniref:Glycosyl hydrolase n=1 Tax=Microbacterium dextranolyticum TaxID=36806 RepID=A0A9W6HJF9_9MICO|nr:glycoside hydrolase family 15 protein [Microbacterium dextranolyticum]MBM7462138.1 GH15 family glucan-1,4-alpha-glucosidase [Microbacterium dextranolyticum]GLJ94385.1 glycosyl hydrolase [Microbacterium dextranolyticum]
MVTVADRGDLRTYAPIGDGRTVALVAGDGGIDWLPLPQLDSTPVFARILDDADGGCLELAPDEEYTVRRRYLAGTNVLQTTFRTASGAVRVTDALVTGVAGRLPWAQLVRRVEGLDGDVRLRWAVRPGTRLRTASPWIVRADGHHLLRVDGTTLAVVGEHIGRTRIEDSADSGLPALGGAFTTASGSRHLLAVVATDGEPLHIPDPGHLDASIERTITGWREWSREFSYDGPWADAVQRSALALKLLVYAPTGAIAAAATTSLPENPAGGKNWDYRFAWVRDLAYTAHALVRFGLREETHAALSWLLTTIQRHGGDPHVMYTLRGDLVDGAQEFDAPGWAGIGPVVAGNPATDQLQLGVYGDLFAICRTYVDAGNILDVGTGALLARLADVVCDRWRSRDSGMWELPSLEHHTSSKMGCWQALRDAVHLSDAGMIPGPSERWAAERDRIAAWVEAECWSEDAGAYTMFPGSPALDASVLLHAESGFDRGERMSRTIDALTEALGRDHLLYRYSGMPDEEHTFTACAFWRANALACVGRHDEAIAAMTALVGQANDVGIYSEMISAQDGSFWGNLPQALSHLAVVGAALTILDVAPTEMLRDL